MQSLSPHSHALSAQSKASLTRAETLQNTDLSCRSQIAACSSGERGKKKTRLHAATVSAPPSKMKNQKVWRQHAGCETCTEAPFAQVGDVHTHTPLGGPTSLVFFFSSTFSLRGSSSQRQVGAVLLVPVYRGSCKARQDGAPDSDTRVATS